MERSGFFLSIKYAVSYGDTVIEVAWLVWNLDKIIRKH